MLGSLNDAEDAIQETWLRLEGAHIDEIENLSGWLTTVLSRICLDMLRTRRSRREDLVEDPPAAARSASDPEAEAMLADSVGEALLVVLGTLDPPERVAFVLHDLFDVPFEDIALIVDKSVVAARQLASRARRRVRGQGALPTIDLALQREVVDAFRLAARGGDLTALLQLLDPDIVLRSDEAAAKLGSRAELGGSDAVANFFSGRAAAAQRATIDGNPGLVWAPGGTTKVAFFFEIVDQVILGIDLVADPERLATLNIAILGDQS